MGAKSLSELDGGAPEGTVYRPGDLNCRPSTVILVKQIADYCEKTYPGWGWAVQPDERGGVIHLRCMRLSGQYGYTMKMADVQSDPHLRRVKQAAGEILERYGMPLTGYNREAWLARERYLNGEAKADVSDKTSRRRRGIEDEQIKDAIKRGLAKFHKVEEGGVMHVVMERNDGAQDEAG